MNSIHMAKPFSPGIERPNNAPIPYLAHDLEQVVESGTRPSMLHELQDSKGRRYSEVRNWMSASMFVALSF